MVASEGVEVLCAMYVGCVLRYPVYIQRGVVCMHAAGSLRCFKRERHSTFSAVHFRFLYLIHQHSNKYYILEYLPNIVYDTGFRFSSLGLYEENVFLRDRYLGTGIYKNKREDI